MICPILEFDVDKKQNRKQLMNFSSLSTKALSIFFAIGFSLVSNSLLLGQTTSVSASKDSLTVGEVFTISLKIQLDKPYKKVIFPDSSAFPQNLEWISTQQFRVTDFADSILYTVQFFENQDVKLSPFPIALIENIDTNLVFSNQITLFFKSVLPSEDAELKPLKPIFDFSSFPWALFLIILAVLLAAGVGYYLFKKSKENTLVQEIIEIEPFRSPLLELETTLNYLKQEYDLASTKDYKYFYTALSDSIRAYYEELYKIPALESTSRELFRYLDAFGVDHEMIKSTRKTLNRSDMVKFAKFTPTLDDAWHCYQFSIDFLDRARLVDAGRVSRKKELYESQFRNPDELKEIESNQENA